MNYMIIALIGLVASTTLTSIEITRKLFALLLGLSTYQDSPRLATKVFSNVTVFIYILIISSSISQYFLLGTDTLLDILITLFAFPLLIRLNRFINPKIAKKSKQGDNHE